jgi:parallel beta-helix repeat protein
MDVTNPQNTVGCRNSIITNNTITGGEPYYCFPIWVEGNNNSITNNHIYGNEGMGIALEKGTGHIIADNLIENNGMYGINFEYGQATVRGNRFNNNTGGPYYFTDSFMGVTTPVQYIDSSNLVDGKPTCYWVNQHDKAVPSDAGIVLLFNCSGITVSGLHIDKGGSYAYCLVLSGTTNSVISDNSITAGNGIRILECRNNASNVSVLRNYITTGMMSGVNTTIASNTFVGKGITLGSYVTVAYNNFTDCDVAINMQGYNCTIRNNNFENSKVGIHMYEGGYNQIYRNNFVGNSKQAEEQHSDPTRWPMNVYYTSTNNSWSQIPPVGGNYWSDYKGADSNGDGFGDSAYHVIENYYDYYPIVKTANTVQPASENLSPSETAQTSTGSVDPTANPTGNPPPASTNNPKSSEYPDLIGIAAPPYLYLWIAIAAVVAGALTGLAVYWRHKSWHIQKVDYT